MSAKRKISDCDCKWKHRYDGLMSIMQGYQHHIQFCVVCDYPATEHSDQGWSFCDTCDEPICNEEDCVVQHTKDSCVKRVCHVESESDSESDSSSSGSSWEG